MDTNEYLKLYQSAINAIDDYFEFRCESGVDKEFVVTILDSLSDELMRLSRGE